MEFQRYIVSVCTLFWCIPCGLESKGENAEWTVLHQRNFFDFRRDFKIWHGGFITQKDFLCNNQINICTYFLYFLTKTFVLWCFFISETSENKSPIQHFESKYQFLPWFFQMSWKINQEMTHTFRSPSRMAISRSYPRHLFKFRVFSHLTFCPKLVI